jgi:hydrogenase maturation protease
MDRSILVLGIGNDILGDDAVGIIAARALKEKYGRVVDIEEAPTGGFALMEYLEGYDRAVLLDAVVTGKHSPGSVIEFTKEDFKNCIGTSPHYVGLPEVFRLADGIGLHFPEELCVFAMEVENPYDFGYFLSPSTEHALPEFIRAVEAKLDQWVSPIG